MISSVSESSSQMHRSSWANFWKLLSSTTKVAGWWICLAEIQTSMLWYCWAHDQWFYCSWTILISIKLLLKVTRLILSISTSVKLSQCTSQQVVSFHNKLLAKLANYGILWNWFNNCSTSATILSVSKSAMLYIPSPLPVLSGVPQDSPLLFLICINDLSLIAQFSVCR